MRTVQLMLEKEFIESCPCLQRYIAEGGIKRAQDDHVTIESIKAELDEITARLDRLMPLIPVTREVRESAPALVDYLRTGRTREYVAHLNNTIRR